MLIETRLTQPQLVCQWFTHLEILAGDSAIFLENPGSASFGLPLPHKGLLPAAVLLLRLLRMIWTSSTWLEMGLKWGCHCQMPGHLLSLCQCYWLPDNRLVRSFCCNISLWFEYVIIGHELVVRKPLHRASLICFQSGTKCCKCPTSHHKLLHSTFISQYSSHFQPLMMQSYLKF